VKKTRQNEVRDFIVTIQPNTHVREGMPGHLEFRKHRTIRAAGGRAPSNLLNKKAPDLSGAQTADKPLAFAGGF
jgi:hypothetical protein